MNNDTPNYMTPEGFQKLKNELHQLLHVERPKIVKTVQWAASLGDRSENADYIYGKRRMREIDRRIRFLEKRLEYALVIDPKEQTSNHKVQFGGTVTLEDEDGEQVQYQIVGMDESDPQKKRISWQSPLAKSLLGKEVGDMVLVRRPKGEIEYEIIQIEYK